MANSSNDGAKKVGNYLLRKSGATQTSCFLRLVAIAAAFICFHLLCVESLPLTATVSVSSSSSATTTTTTTVLELSQRRRQKSNQQVSISVVKFKTCNQHNNMWLARVDERKQRCNSRRTLPQSSYLLRLVPLLLLLLAFAQLLQRCNCSPTDELTTGAALAEEARKLSEATPTVWAHDKRLFSIELLRLLHEQYAAGGQQQQVQVQSEGVSKKEDRQQQVVANRQQSLNLLLNALGADGDMRRLVDWLQNSFNLASVGELTTQFVVSKLGSVNCAALLKPDPEETLVPRFLLFNENFVDVPFELPARPTSTECLTHGRFEPARKTIVLIHGYLAGYTLVDGITNIKNRILDINKHVSDRAMAVFAAASRNNNNSNSSATYVLTEDLEQKVKSQMYNVIIVDWFNGANPVPRSRYIRAATNAQVVGKLIARFLTALVSQCRTPASNIQILAHSLGCHVAGFTGKAMQASGHRLGRITHLDPVGLCFGRLFSEPSFRLNPNDAIETQAVHVSLNLFDNPLDGAQTNFLVNGGRDQIGCTGNELQNSTTSSVSLLFDSNAKFTPCSHLRAIALYEDDHSSEPNQCQLVGYRCANYDRFLAGKCGTCDAQNNQCRLMSLPPVLANFRKIDLKREQQQQHLNSAHRTPANYQSNSKLVSLVKDISNGSIAWVIDDKELNQKIGDTVAKMKPELVMASTPDSYLRSAKQQAKVSSVAAAAAMTTTTADPDYIEEYPSPPGATISNEIRRLDRKLSSEHRDKLAQTIDKIRAETRHVLSEGWTSLTSGAETKLKVVSLINKSPFHLPTLDSLDKLTMPTVTIQSHNQHAASDHHSTLSHQTPLVDPTELLEPPQLPLGSQAIPAGSVNGPLFFLGTGPVSPHCVNYYQFRMLVAEARINRLLASRQHARSAAAATTKSHLEAIPARLMSALPLTRQQALAEQQQLLADKLHLTIKLSDANGHFFKGFTLSEDTRSLTRVPIPTNRQKVIVGSEYMVELTMLLNTTQAEPVKVSESIVSYYFHKIVLADYIEVNFMSNISPEVRARYSSVLCPTAINDQHQLVRYVECSKLPNRRR